MLDPVTTKRWSSTASSPVEAKATGADCACSDGRSDEATLIVAASRIREIALKRIGETEIEGRFIVAGCTREPSGPYPVINFERLASPNLNNRNTTVEMRTGLRAIGGSTELLAQSPARPQLDGVTAS